MANKSRRAPSPTGTDSPKCHADNGRRGAAACNPSKSRACAPHCATALLLAVLSNEPVALRPGCCMLTKGSEARAPKQGRRVPGRPTGRHIRPDAALVGLHLAGDD